jgi:alpha-L-rhamnosidase
VLPLAFGLVPKDIRQRIFNHLVDKILNESNGHIRTGLVGGQFLNQVLTDGGRADLVYRIATQQTYPSWGFRVAHGATTIWEVWNGNTADQLMNSQNHVMLIGDLVVWLYEDLAGIKPDLSKPGFKHIIMQPHPVSDLHFVKASHLSPYGLIVSDWKRDNATFDWRLEIPANTTATIYVPATSLGTVREEGVPASRVNGVESYRYENDRAILQVASGKYHFIAK